MTIFFKGTPEEMMSSFFAGLKRAEGDSAGAQAALRQALAMLVGLHHAQHEHGAIDGARLARFRQESASAMLAHRDRLSFQVNEALILAEDANDYEWPRLCMSRSVIQFLIDDYTGTPVPELIDRDDLAELDEEMERVGGRQGPLDDDQIPKGMPASHWWWRYPHDEDEGRGEDGDTPPQGGEHPLAQDAAPQLARGILVLDPQRDFEALRAALAGQGWQAVNASQQPIIPGEPEHALFERDAQHLAYSFNPVCRLRLIDVPLDLDHETVAQFAVQNVGDVKPWLMSSDERTQLRGILAGPHLPDGELLAGVEKLKKHPRASIANAAAQSSELMRQALQSDDRARATAMAAIELLKQQLTPLIFGLAADASGTLTAELRPRTEDYARAFHPAVADKARRAYEALWVSPPRVSSAPSGSQLRLNVAPAGMLAEDNELSRHFPSGYRAIATLLDPHRVWVAWKLIPPGKDAGMAYDGLVWLDDHWAWFPKPYRVLADLLRA